VPIELTHRFVKQYAMLPAAIRVKVDKALLQLDSNFRWPGLRSHPVEGTDGIFEAYVDRKYRMTFQRRGDAFVMRNVDKHDACLHNP